MNELPYSVFEDFFIPVTNTTKKVFDEEGFIEYLIKQGDAIMFVGKNSVTVELNSSDIFAWGYAASEPIEYDEIPNIFKHYSENTKTGIIKWICLKYNEQPQAPIKKYMIENGGWDLELDSLPKNKYDSIVVKNNN